MIVADGVDGIDGVDGMDGVDGTDVLAPLDPADPAFARDPYPYYARLRGRGPAARVPLANGTYAWLVTGYEEARAVLADPRFSNVPAPDAGRPKAESPARQARACLARHMLNSDAPDHTRLRRLTAAAFTPRRVDALRPRIEELTSGLLADVAERLRRDGSVDLVDAFAFPLPVLVIGEVLGVPEADRADLRDWTYRVGSPADALTPGAVDAAWTSLHAYFTELIARKRRAPGPDLFSALTHDATEGGLDDGELLAMAFLLLFAGYETTMNLLASASLLLLTHPEELAAARHAPARWPAVVEETLRHASPLEGTTWRRTTEEVDLGGGTVIPAGASVLAVLAAASRDPRHFPDPDAFRPERYLAGAGAVTGAAAAPGADAGAGAGAAQAGAGSATALPGARPGTATSSTTPLPNPRADAATPTCPASPRAAPHTAFGHGPHFCVGSRLARLEAAIALPRLFDAFPELQLTVDPEQLPYRPGLLVRGPRHVPVR
ncbi:cytochrome P450 [Streptomyces sp. NBC_01381]|uniref:cytochrome P450 n=1 Tax=Streptomyces sp. NBC_01381 TaxID=2903845 RepID=UPI0022539D3D|nr:cytochrome P450 [Streptomyces sp. NBC_01381]MCX4669169.1 cytochrome P450 [Streptomyces sp. NBC_01381]